MIRVIFALLIFIAPAAFAAAPVQQVEKNIWLIEDHTLPIVTVKLQFKNSGAAYDPSAKEGLASFVTQLLDEGAGDMDSLTFQHALEERAIRFGASADEDTITVTLQTLSESKTRAFELFNLALAKPRFDPAAVERIRSSIISDLHSLEQNPGYIASRSWKSIAFGNHPYAHPRRGTQTSVASITQSDLTAFFNSHFIGEQMTISVVGDITAAEVKSWNASFPVKRSSAIQPSVKDISVPYGTAPHVVTLPVPQTVVTASLPGVLRSDPNYYALTVLNHIVGGNSLTSRLGREIRDKRGLAYYADSGLEEYQHSGVISAHFATRNEEAYAALKVCNDVFADVAAHGVTEGELNDAKHYLTGSFPLALDSQGSLADYLLVMQQYNLGTDYLEKRNSLIDSVTLAQVNAVAKQLFSKAPLVVMAGEPKEKH